jgi:indolepyruvate ferredoxin oxidoreductase
MTGNQALVRLPMLQKQRDIKNGLHTAGYISGYRGSPIGTYDFELEKSKDFLQKCDIVFQPGINEDLAATAVWGTQQVEVEEDKKFDGVFSIWYAKAPGVYRSGDVLKHGSFYGASPHGGVLLIPGDDHNAKSSTIANYSDPEMIAHGSPILYPSNIQEVIDFGLMGWALSRYSGAWVTLKVIGETIEGTSTVDLDLGRSETRDPEGQNVPPEAHWRTPDVTTGLGPMRDAERMAFSGRVSLVKAFARLNRFDKVMIDAPERKLGVVTSGKPYQDLMRALQLLNISKEKAKAMGLSIYKVAMPWPLENESFAEFAEGQDEILVIEEKQALMEHQIIQQMFNWPENKRPRVVGKQDENGDKLQEVYGAVTPVFVMSVLASRLKANGLVDADIEEAMKSHQQRLSHGCGVIFEQAVRLPYFCSGCPHNRSTKTPEGSKVMGGIGCHQMSSFMGRKTGFTTQMGGEGHLWVGMSHFVESKHRFQNLGDGTYTHSGMHAVHGAVVQGVNITYKVLYNDAVAMTGGQQTEGHLTVQQISHQALAMGVVRTVVTTDEPDKYKGQLPFASGVTVHHRDELDKIQRELREVKGVTMIINDQTCAAEKRRRRKRGEFPDPQKRVFINDAVCEACGDCSVQANCISIQSKKTNFGNKRYIDQSGCNKDYSCVDGFCPSFVTVHGGKLRKAIKSEGDNALFDDIPTPNLPSFKNSYAIMINGIGGTGVVTIGAVLGMAAHLEDKSASIYDMTGFAQKGGAVQSHLRIGMNQEDITCLAIGAGDSDLILGCDLVVTAGEESMRSINPNHTRAVVNSDPVATAALQLMRDFELPTSALIKGLEDTLGENLALVDATQVAYALTGNSIASNMFVVGYAFQKGWLPLSEKAILKAIKLNGIAIEFNQNAFQYGRVAAHDYSRLAPLVEAHLNSLRPDVKSDPQDVLELRMEHLTRYQNADYAEQYKALVDKVMSVEAEKVPGKTELSKAVVGNYFKLMAYKDEYEVARLYTDGEFIKKLESQFDGDYKLGFNLAPPLLSKKDPLTGELKKREYGGWIFKVFGLLAKFKGLRGTPLDIFGYTVERKMERRLITEYRDTITKLLNELNGNNYEIAVNLANLPSEVRGYGHVKEAAVVKMSMEKSTLLQDFSQDDKKIASDKNVEYYEAV